MANMPLSYRREALKNGFTMVELVLVIVVLGIVSISLSGIVKNAVTTVVDVNQRESVVREGTFLLERMNREIKNAVPNSIRIRGNSTAHCIEFVPLNWTAHYFTLPLVAGSSKQANVLELNSIDGTSYVPQSSDFGIVFPTKPSQVYDAAEQHRQAISACSDDGDGDCATLDDADKVVQLDFADGFASTSPSRRIYIADQAVSYCLRGQSVYRHSSSINTNQSIYLSGGVLMAEQVVNQLGSSPSSGTQNPFTSVAATLQRNGATQILLVFAREDERFTFLQEVQTPNAP